MGSARFEARVGHAFSGTDGLVELRAGIDVVLGGYGAVVIVVGAVWQLTPFADVPIDIGPTLELGGSFAFTGGQSAGSSSAAAPWRAGPRCRTSSSSWRSRSFAR